MNKKLLVGLAAAALAVVPMTAASADNHLGSLSVITEAISADTPAGVQVVAVHGVPPETFEALGVDSTAVDIYANGDAVLEGVQFGDSAVLSDLPNAEYTIEIRVAGSDADSDALLSLGPADLADVSVSVVAHLNTDGDPVLNAYTNETGEGAGIQPFHTANFGAVDILAGGDAVLEGVTNGMTQLLAVGAGEVPGVGIAVAGEDEAALDLGAVDVPEDTIVLAYAVGQLPVEGEADDAEEVEAPEEEHSPGEAGLASTALPLWVVALMALGALSITVPALARKRNN